MESRRRLEDLVDLKTIQTIQDNCSKAMGLAFVTVDYKGSPVTQYSGFTDYCMLGRSTPGFAEMCAQCDAHGGLHAAITGQPYIYRCHADLVDFAVPLILDGSYVGAVLGGQVRVSEEEERELERIIPQHTNWRKNEGLLEASTRIQTVTYDKLEASVVVLRDMILYMLEEEYKKVLTNELEGKGRELIAEKAVRSDLESAIRERELNVGHYQAGMHYFFFVMNVLTRLAYQEKAPLTESVAYDFASMMRYTIDSNHPLATLGEELNYIGCLLRIQKAWLRDTISYEISVPEGYWNIPCPFMVLQPLLEPALEGVDQSGGEVRTIKFFVEEDGGDLLLQITYNGKDLSEEDVETLLNTPDTLERPSLYDANRKLKSTFGKHYGLKIQVQREGGIAAFVRLPLSWAGLET